jgi:hypothetical protein
MASLNCSLSVQNSRWHSVSARTSSSLAVKTAYLHHAQEAVRFAEKGREIHGPGKTSESRVAVEGLLWEAREILRRAERDMEELKDLRKRIKAGEVKWEKGEKLRYGNINGISFSYQSFPYQYFPCHSFPWQSFP